MRNFQFKKTVSVFLAGIFVLTLLACNKNAKETVKSISPVEFAKDFIIARNKPDTLAVDNYTLAGGEDAYKYEAKSENKSEKEYFMSISDDKATDYTSFVEYRNDYVLNYRQEYYGSTAMKTEFEGITSKKLDSKKVEKVREYFKMYDFINTDKIYEAFKVRAKFKTTVADTTEDKELFLLILNYDGQAKYFVSNESEEEFDKGFD
ncbi:MAG TPA: hypothetical protein DEW35_05645 [Ruminococcaceae bacterium]|nr:hypothetical protein [Oscillospiraceae bacterium]